MKLTVEKETLLKALQKVTNIIGTRTTLPVLANVLLEAADGVLKITTTDLEIRLETKVAAEIEVPGRTTLPARKLLGLVSKFRGGNSITLDSNENFHTSIKCGTASIMLLGLSPDDFPIASDFEIQRTITLKQLDFMLLIDRIAYSASNEDSRKVLQGILFSVRESTVTAVATDGKRLALMQKTLENVPEGSDGDTIITLKAANELKRLLETNGDCVVEIGEKQIQFRLTDTTVVSKIIDGTYPNYRQVIPADFKRSINIPCDPFIYALEILSVTLSDITSPNIKLTFKPNQLLFEANSNIGEGSESIPIEYDGEEMSASFNPNFLLDPFKHLSMENVALKLNDVVSPIALESPDGFLYVIMPMRNK